MWKYYLKISWLSVRNTPMLSLLMVLAIATGIATCLTMFTMYAVISDNPMGHKNETIFAVQLDSWDPNREYHSLNNIPPQLTYTDAKALYDAEIADQIVVMRKTGVTVQLADLSGKASVHPTRMTTRDFFSMFDVKFMYGGPWGLSEDHDPGKVAVISEGLNDKFFNGIDSTGKTILLDREVFVVVGVVSDSWKIVPTVYDLNNSPFEAPPEVYIPFFNVAERQYAGWGNTQGWKNENDQSYEGFLQSHLVWVQAWVALESIEKRQEFSQFIENYIAQQKQHGRFQRPTKYRLNTPQEWLTINKVISDDNRVLLALSFAFLVICLVNSMVLLLAKFLRKAPEAGIRRALGASRQSIFVQHLAESLLIGVAGGVLGLLLSWIGLAGVRQLYNDYSSVAAMSGVTVAAAIFLAVFSSLCSGFLPAWRISNAAPARYLKIQ